jgi:hypothetical protein
LSHYGAVILRLYFENGLFIASSYAKSMTNHGYGYGFYDPESTKDVQPGLCNYVDDSGQWQTIVDLSNHGLLSKKGYSTIAAVETMSTTKRRWGPKTSSSVVRKETTLDVKASDASILWTYGHSSDFGAIVLCPGDVVNDGYQQKSPFRKWAKENAKEILKNHLGVKKHWVLHCHVDYSVEQSSKPCPNWGQSRSHRHRRT